MDFSIFTPAPATGLLPDITAHLQSDPRDAGDFLAVAVRLLRQRQLRRRDVQEKLRQFAERKGVARW